MTPLSYLETQPSKNHKPGIGNHYRKKNKDISDGQEHWTAAKDHNKDGYNIARHNTPKRFHFQASVCSFSPSATKDTALEHHTVTQQAKKIHNIT